MGSSSRCFFLNTHHEAQRGQNFLGSSSPHSQLAVFFRGFVFVIDRIEPTHSGHRLPRGQDDCGIKIIN